MDNEYKPIEKAVLNVYKKVSPSFLDIENKDIFIKLKASRSNLMSRLGLPPLHFQGRKLLDIGGGTGEKSLIYSLNGSNVTIVEPNEISCERASELFKKYGQKLNLINKSLYSLDVEEITKYDIVCCQGVLQHTYNPIKGLDILTKNLKPGAILIVSLVETNSWFQRMMQRDLIKQVAGDDEEKIIKASKHYFQEHLDRAVKYGLRSERNIIYDTFVNPQIKPTDLQDICNTYFKNNVFHLASYPRLDFFQETTPFGQQLLNAFDYENNREYYNFLEKIWLTCGIENLNQSAKNFNLTESATLVQDKYDQLIKLKQKIATNSFKEGDLVPIKKGYLGVGLNWFVGVKHIK